MLVAPSEIKPAPRCHLSEHFSIVPPAGWEPKVSFSNLPLRLMAYGRLLFLPPGVGEVCLKWQIADWLEGQSEWEIFLDLLAFRSKPTTEQLNGLYSVLLRIPVEYVSEYSVTEYPGLGPALVIDYNLSQVPIKGRVMYVTSPTGPFDVQIVSYEGSEPIFSTYLIDALIAMDSCRQTRPLTILQSLMLPQVGM